jgi:hypothetical protein
MIRIALPYQLRMLAKISGEVELAVSDPVTIRSVLDAVEERYPMLRGTLRDQTTKQRRPLIRFYACEEDFSNASPDDPLPSRVAAGEEPLLIIGAIAGG